MKNEYITKDLGEAAALLTSQCIMRSLQWKDNTAYFLFEDPETCQKIAHQYFFENLSLNVRNFYENLRMVKRRLYAEQNSMNNRRGGV